MKRKMLLLVSLFIVASGIEAADSVHRNYELIYFEHKKKSSYQDALTVLGEWSQHPGDPYTAELNLYRIYELTLFDDLVRPGLKILSRLQNNELFTSNQALRDRLNTILIRLYLKTGQPDKAKTLHKRLGYMAFYSSLPYNTNSRHDFDTLQTHSSQSSVTKQFKVSPSLTGEINFGHLFPVIQNKSFYLFRNIDIQEAGTYYFHIGKTGYTDILINGSRVFSNRVRHSFFPGQYVLKTALDRGTHRITVKTGDSPNGLRFSMRMTGPDGENFYQPLQRKPQHTKSPQATLQSLHYFSALDHYLNQQGDTDLNLFNMAYLIHMAGLNNEAGRTTFDLFNKINKKSFYYTFANYYIGLAMKNTDLKDIFFRRSHSADPKNIEPLVRLALLKINNNYLFQGHEIIKNIESIVPNCTVNKLLRIQFYNKKGWDFASIKACKALLHSSFASQAHLILYNTYYKQHDYSSALKHALIIYNKNHLSYGAMNALTNCYLLIGDHPAAVRHLNKAISVFPNSVNLRLQLSDVIEQQYGAKESLPYLSSAQKLSPANSRVLHKLGLQYRALGEKHLALFYLKQAAASDHDNFELKTYIDFLENKQPPLAQYLSKLSLYKLETLSDKYKDEPVIILANDKIISVNPDGSYKKHIRKIIKINSSSALEEFSHMSVVYDPELETIENVTCFILEKNMRTPITGKYIRSLSDPEAKLYYNLEQLIIPLSGLKPGQTIHFSYELSNKSGKVYHNYFGQKFVLGNKYRTLVSNNVLIHPKQMKIYAHVKELGRGKLKSRISGSNRLYIAYMTDLHPVKNEPSMPKTANVLPAVYFTTFKNWNELYQWYTGYLRNKIVVSPEMRNDLKSILHKGDSKDQIVEKIYSHVISSIRYVGFEFGIGGIKPRRTDETYASKMGDCKDVSLVLVAMLREAGLDARLALVNTRDNGSINYKVPIIENFNHAICYVNTGSIYFIDGTVKHGGYREIPDSNLDIKAFVIGKGSHAFINTNSPVYYTNSVSTRNTVTINNNGSVVVDRNIRKTGSYALFGRQETQQSDDKLKTLSQYWNEQFTGSEIQNLRLTSNENNKPLEYSYTITIPEYARVTAREIIIPAFLTTSKYFSIYGLSPDRQHPVILDSIGTTQVNISYHVPADYTVSHLPEAAVFKHKDFSASFTYTLKGNTIYVSSAVTTSAYRIDPDQYKTFRKFTVFISKKETEKIVLSLKNKKEPV